MPPSANGGLRVLQGKARWHDSRRHACTHLTTTRIPNHLPPNYSHTHTHTPTHTHTHTNTHTPTHTHTQIHTVSERASSNCIRSSKGRLEYLSPELKHSSIASFDARSIKLQNIMRNYPEFPLPVSASLSTQTATYGVCEVPVLRKCRLAKLETKNCVLWQK